VPAPVRVVLGAALTMIVMVVSVIPPILHFFTGPMGPGIGGFIAGKQLKLSDKEAAVMGVLVALAAGVPAFILMDRLIANETFVVFAAIVASIWAGGLSTVAAWFAGGADEQPEDEVVAGK
jgi:hypothetical protein